MHTSEATCGVHEPDWFGSVGLSALPVRFKFLQEKHALSRRFPDCTVVCRENAVDTLLALDLPIEEARFVQ